MKPSFPWITKKKRCRYWVLSLTPLANVLRPFYWLVVVFIKRGRGNGVPYEVCNKTQMIVAPVFAQRSSNTFGKRSKITNWKGAAENSLKTEKSHNSDDMGLFWKVCRRNVIHFCYFHYPNKGSCGLVFEKHIFRKKAMQSEKTHITVCAVRLDRRRCVWWDSFNFLSSSENQNKFNWITCFLITNWGLKIFQFSSKLKMVNICDFIFLFRLNMQEKLQVNHIFKWNYNV